MKRSRLIVLSLVILLNVGPVCESALAQTGDPAAQLRNPPPKERRQAAEKFRPARAHNLERVQHPERIRNAERFRNPRGVPGTEKPQDGGKFQQRPEEMRPRAPQDGRPTDMNGARGLSREEAARSTPQLSRHFDEIDLNHDGIVSPEEARAFREKRRQQRLNRGDGDPRF